MNYMTTVGCAVWIQTENRPTPYFGSRGKAVVKRQHHLLPRPFQLIIPSHPISRHLQSETLTQSSHKLRRQIKLSGQTQAPTALLPVKETPFPIERATGWITGDGGGVVFNQCLELNAYSSVVQRVLFTVVAELFRFHFSTVGLFTTTHCPSRELSQVLAHTK